MVRLPYDIPQAWSAALHAHPDDADGIAYSARHDDEAICAALFERAQGAIIEFDREADLDVDRFWNTKRPDRPRREAA